MDPSVFRCSGDGTEDEEMKEEESDAENGVKGGGECCGGGESDDDDAGEGKSDDFPSTDGCPGAAPISRTSPVVEEV